MAKDLLEAKLKQFGDFLDKKSFISTPESLIDTFSDDLDDKFYTSFRVEALRMIFLHNQDVIKTISDSNCKLEELISRETIVPESNDEVHVLEHSSSLPVIDRHDSVIDFFNHEKNSDVIVNYIEDIIKNRRDVLPFVKLYFYKKSLSIRSEMARLIALDPTSDISKLRSEYDDISFILDCINDSYKEDNTIVEEENTEIDIITIPSSKYSSTILEDIVGYEERYKEIKTALDKILAGYIKNKKDTKQLKGFDKLYEYTHPNGIRILFVLLPNNKIALCSLFFKDKQKSTRITGYYEEALSRFESYKDVILENVSNLDFLLNQFDIVGEIYEELDSRIPKLTKKGSDQDV